MTKQRIVFKKKVADPVPEPQVPVMGHSEAVVIPQPMEITVTPKVPMTISVNEEALKGSTSERPNNQTLGALRKEFYAYLEELGVDIKHPRIHDKVKSFLIRYANEHNAVIYRQLKERQDGEAKRAEKKRRHEEMRQAARARRAAEAANAPVPSQTG